MKLTKILAFFAIMCLLIPTFMHSTDISYLHDYKWKILFKCYDDGCSWIWKFCRTVCINENGEIYNNTNAFKVGEWFGVSETAFEIELISDCGGLYGTIFFLSSPSVGMEGQGYSYLWGTRKVVKIFLVREEPR